MPNTLKLVGTAALGAAVAYAVYKKFFAATKMRVHVSSDKGALGAAAAAHVATVLESIIDAQGSARVIFATGASQFEFLEALRKYSVRWDRVTAFHLDEYVGLEQTHGASFRKYLHDRLFSLLIPSPGAVHYLNPDDPESYARLLGAAPIDLACIGIGENGHIAFNDPPPGGCDFDDPLLVKQVPLDDGCRKQQLGEGWFPTLADVPTHAVTLTVPAIMGCKRISCVVPDARKAEAVRGCLQSPIGHACPATILRTHPDCTLWLDAPSASLVGGFSAAN